MCLEPLFSRGFRTKKSFMFLTSSLRVTCVLFEIFVRDLSADFSAGF